MVASNFLKLGAISVYLLLCSRLATAILRDGRMHGNIMHPPTVPIVSMAGPDSPVTSRNGTILPPYNTTYFFDQLIDHNNPSLGTFKQRFWHTWEFYEPGGPIILMTPGEVNAQGYPGYLTNRTINGLIAQQQNGSAIVLEHRFYGLSNPHPDLSVASLQVHTIQQAIDDLEYFANNVVLPMPDGDKVTPDKAPWILIGGSYSGALTSWTMVNKPGLFFAGYASSGVVEAILDFWQYFEPIREFQFNITCGIGIKDGKSAPAAGWGLGHALSAWGSYFKNSYLLTICGDDPAEDCLGTYNTSQAFWTDTTIDNAGRSWMWIVCNEVGYLQGGAPVNQPTLVTRLVQPPYYLRLCQQMFSAAFPEPPHVQIERTNSAYQGWDVRINHLFFANGMRDPWRDATISAEGLNVRSTSSQPIFVSDGFHCSDLGASSAAVDPTIANVQNNALAAMKVWLTTWKPNHSGQHSSSPRSTAQIIKQSESVQPVSTKPLNAWFRGAGIV
ncbi:serine carboxypeptidase S28-domain-containing protein [Cyathus striatus]|nr:serine carboxypeptidase S28-domain-containing protein [Cyathus striatus]